MFELVVLLQTCRTFCWYQKLLTRLLCVQQASSSSSDGMLTLDLIQEEDSVSRLGLGEDPDPSESLLGPECPRSKTDGELSARGAEPSERSQSLPREAAVWDKVGPGQTPPPDQHPPPAEKNRCSSMDEILTPSESGSTETRTPVTSPRSGSAPSDPIRRLQELIEQKLEQTERLLTQADGADPSPEGTRAETQRLLQEAASTWTQAREVLQEVKELRELYRQLDSSYSGSASNSSRLSQNHRSLM